MTPREPDADQQAAFAAVQAQGKLCLGYIRTLKPVNQRIAERARAGDPTWSRMAAEGYNQACRDRRGAAAPGSYGAAIQASDDLKLVCDTRWVLGEAVDVLRERLQRLDTIAAPYDDFERCIRQSITGVDRSPAELASGIESALALGTRAVAWRPPPTEAGTLVDRWKRRLQNNPITAAIIVMGLALAGAFALYNAIPDDLRPLLGLHSNPK